MRTEFNSRVDFQRQVLKVVNNKGFKNQLSGLSKPALDNWFIENKIVDKELKEIMYIISEKLFFIANKSQDQITEEYQKLQLGIRNEIYNLEKMLN
jgi:hypothetical protein